ncbi:deoxyguanosinetriphosphate triphosphohydrolase [Thermobrachium celere]|uniref:Deoxyguanosinetriphosphate triphosphohydrolase-like protein n=1 Tax=Thermobrachium celere DSM 8682 TaxID=941824 RepID=R7RS44_9CLOT|nr:deoxyguanosinetriphosphate triphosphohydrolase [Thermobrachium celere]GFR34495.1 deoxyguanosinetriphosphate triphosphohydrolase-like protein [Thermobrachium celere]CDF58055.1 Deoxyguanosinetriphosphate triphosphohydrolase [Thermobrachium celere DSM 8682]
MNIREHYEQLEEKILSPLATKSKYTKGRLKFEEKCNIRTEFQRDRDRIIHSKAFRRLKHKTQVFIAPEGDHYRTRLTHTLEVAQIARTISRAIGLNEDLTEAIALGHDLGHTPFGHTGENVLNKIASCGFKHYEQSLRVVDFLEKGTGLNLTYEVRNGILCHSSNLEAETNEGKVVKLADKIAYINHDIDDAIRAGIITIDDLPKECIKVLGKGHSERINKMITAVIEHAIKFGVVALVGEIGQATWELRDFMFKNVYIGSKAKQEEEKAIKMIQALYEYYYNNPNKMPTEFINRIEEWGKERVVCDFIAGMTDRYAINEFINIYIPLSWGKIY